MRNYGMSIKNYEVLRMKTYQRFASLIACVMALGTIGQGYAYEKNSTTQPKKNRYT